MLPMIDTGRAIGSGSRESRTRTRAPAAWPSLKRGMRTIPSARTREVITPAPRPSGVTHTRSPTCPTVTRKYSSSPARLSTLRVSSPSIVGGGAGTIPSQRSSSGLTKISPVRAAETG